MKFYTILVIPNITVIYCHVTCPGKFSYYLNLYASQCEATSDIYVVYSSDNGQMKFEQNNITLFYSKINYEGVLQQHNLNHNKLVRFKKLNLLYTNILQELNIPSVDKLTECSTSFGRKTNPLIKLGIEDMKELLNRIDVDSIPENEFTLEEFQRFLLSIFNKNFKILNFFKNEFLSWTQTYSFPVFSQLRTPYSYTTVSLNNVFYKNKCFFDEQGNLLSPQKLEKIKKDVEYNSFNTKPFNISLDMATFVEDPVLFLDYIYDHYNFGEFWDIIQRLMFYDGPKPTKLFALQSNKVTNIEEYFQKIGYNFPPEFLNKVKWNDYGPNDAVFFRKIYFSLITDGCRGSVNPWLCYQMNRAYNTSNIIEENYKLYLVRGKMARGIVNETEIVDVFKNKYGFKILDGSESLELQKHYFTNASFIIGAHGSLMKNIVWCQKRPIFIEMCPASRTHMCFYGNAVQLEFPSLILPFLCNEKEEIIIEQDQREALYKLTELFLQTTQ